MPRSDSLELDLGTETVTDMLSLLGISKKKPRTEAAELPPDDDLELDPASQEEAKLNEAISTKRLQGSIQLRGFDPDVVHSISDSIRFRVQAANFGNRVRLIIDIQK